MKNNNEILSGLKSGNRGLSVPEGYFEDLNERLCAIPAKHPARKNSTMRVFVPALAGAAAALIAGAFIFTRTSSNDAGNDAGMLTYEQCMIADLIPRTDPYIYFSDEIKHTDRYPDGDIAEYIEYLIEH